MSELPIGSLPASWRVVKLGDVCSKIGSGATPRGGGAVYVDEGIAFIRSQNVYDNEFSDDGLVHIDDEAAEQLKGVAVQQGDVLLNITGDSILRTCCAPVRVLPARVSQHVAIIRPKHDLDSLFLQKYLTLPSVKEYMLGHSAGGTRKAITKGHIQEFLVPVPPVEEQRAIADVLGALDDKIESNRRISATARSLCDAVFQANTDTEERLSAVSTVTMGSSPPGDTYNSRGDGLPFYQGVTDFGFLSPSRRVWTLDPIRIAEAGSTLISVRAPVGRLNEASERCCIGRGVASASSENQAVLYYALRQADAVWAPFESEGTVFGSINRRDLEGAKIPWISGSKIDQVEADLRTIHGRVRAAVAEIVTLEKVREALLPELLSGRVRVGDAEKVVEGAL